MTTKVQKFLKLEVVRMEDLKPGDTLRVDDGFDCMVPWSDLVVQQGGHGLFVPCAGPNGEGAAGSERHYLGGQITDDGTLTGVRRVARAT